MNEELHPYLETPKLILTLIQSIDIGLKQGLIKKKKNLAEKAQVVLYAFLSHFSILQILVCHYNNNNNNNKDFISRG